MHLFVVCVAQVVPCFMLFIVVGLCLLYSSWFFFLSFLQNVPPRVHEFIQFDLMLDVFLSCLLVRSTSFD